MEHTRAAYDDVAVRYNETLDPDGSGLIDPRLEDLVGDVQGRAVLSLACGQGRDARFLADRGAHVVGFDISERLLTYARQFEQDHPRGISYVHGDAQDLLPLDDETFDGVVCHMALMDIPELPPTIAAVARVLRPSGFFVLSIVHPCYGPHLEAIDDYLVDGPYEKVAGPDWLPPRAHHRSLSTYVNTLAAAGFSITQMIEPPDELPAGPGVPNILYLRCTATLS
jgi:ubiquinone/menaquinone biosynthesis C-methylase UbiE